MDIAKDQIKAVIFDVYGTLCEIRDKRRPFKKLLVDHPRRNELAELVMTKPIGLYELANSALPSFKLNDLGSLEKDLYEELLSVELYPEVADVLHTLKRNGFQIAIASNLALPYAVPIRHLLPFEINTYAWSFEVGCIKPNPGIYQWVGTQLGRAPYEMLMVGDTYSCDYEGALQCGLKALHLERNKPTEDGQSINNLWEIVRRLELD
jgi:FMN phosphatase YigB (HAD superfamily)